MKKLVIVFFLCFFSVGNLQADEIQDRIGDTKIVYLDFWASWCTPCKASFPWMNEMAKKFESQGLKIITVNLDTKKEKADKFLLKYPANFTVIFDSQAKLAEKYSIVGMPTSYILDKDGKILYTHIGFRNHEKDILQEKIEYFLNK